MPGRGSGKDAVRIQRASKSLVEALQTHWYQRAARARWGESNDGNAHCTLESLADYTRYTGDRAYTDKIRFVARRSAIAQDAIGCRG